MANLSRTDYMEVALDLLAKGGPKAVTIANLCERLTTTKGSFYHHFKNGEEFLHELIVYWQQEYGMGLAAHAMAATDPGVILEDIRHVSAYEVRHEAERAIRALSQTDPFVARIVKEVDQGREEMFRNILVNAGIDAESARVLASIGVAILIGAQQRGRRIDRNWLHQMFEEYAQWLEWCMLRDQSALASTLPRQASG